MNSNVMPSIVQIEKENLKKLVEEVKETLATDIDTNTIVSKQKSFGLVDLWNRQRSMRTATFLRKY
ncbi:hypothetical protein [Segetibacter koreensis]|uniref:hypothetical protein n=1 Tax=Segetibacter koreensis TaxID=398037 RepID=UPI00036D7333|nr:hypothetical protein [Segetibacter koreensis]